MLRISTLHNMVPNLHITRQSSCVNTRGIPPASYQVLAMLFCLRGYPLLAGRVPQSCPGVGGTPVLSFLGYPKTGVPPPPGTWIPPTSDCNTRRNPGPVTWVPPSSWVWTDKQAENITFPRPLRMQAVKTIFHPGICKTCELTSWTTWNRQHSGFSR